MAKLKTGRHTTTIKAWRQSERLSAKNRAIKNKIRQAFKEFKVLIGKKDFTSAQNTLPKLYSMLDKAVQKGTFHKKTAARKKSRLCAQIKTIAQNPSVK